MASRKHEVKATDAFYEDLDAAVDHYVNQAGPRSATRFLSSYESFARLLESVPGHGTPVEGTRLRWRKVGVFIAVYDTDDEARSVMLLCLFYLSSNWRPRAMRLGEK